jgi:glycosyltransferase involved in cell wall biosynthesis
LSRAADATTPLRILIVVDGLFPATGGAEMQARLLGRELTAAGHSVEFVAPLLDRRMARSEVIDGLQLTRLAYPRIRLLGAIVLCARFALWLWARRDRYDAIHVHMAKNLAATAGLLRPWMRSTLTVKISGAWEFVGGILDPARRGNPLYRAFNWCMRRADCIQCISEYTRERLREAGYAESRLRLIPNAVDLTRFKAAPRATGERVHVVYVGRIEKVKGLPVLLEAWRLSGLGNRARLTIAGGGTQLDTLKRLAAESGIDGSIAFPGSITDVPALLATANVYVQPSLQEGLPNSVLEAMAMGLPIVATRISGNEDVVADGVNGRLVPSGDAPQLARALQELVDDPRLALEMGEQSRQRVNSRFSVPAVLRQLERAYRGLEP